ncbi:MAG: DUF6429 family protein [Armatimonadota bacterium]|nr:DUF6429 family protein [Armatimonadota bacterium]
MSNDQKSDGVASANEFIRPDNSDEIAQEFTLMLLYLNSWMEKPYNVRRAWKGYDFSDLDKLAELELISDSRKAKSVYLTEEGEKKAQALLRKYGLIAKQS